MRPCENLRAPNRASEKQMTTTKKSRAIVVRYVLTADQKQALRKVARELGYRGLRELLQHRGTTDLP
jgi:hypothetical protein